MSALGRMRSSELPSSSDSGSGTSSGDGRRGYYGGAVEDEAQSVPSRGGVSATPVRLTANEGGFDTPGGFAAAKAGLGGPSPEPTAGFFSTITFWWLNSLVYFGHKFPIMQENLFQLRTADLSAVASRSFAAAWRNVIVGFKAEAGDDAEALKAKAKSAWPVVNSLRHAFGGRFTRAAGFKLAQDLIQFSGPLLLAQTVTYVQDPSKPAYLGYLYLIQTMCINQYFHQCFRSGMHVRSALVGAVYAKALKLSSQARAGYTAGEITNLMSNDVSRVQAMAQFLHLTWSCPLQIVIALSLLFRAIGWSALAGVFIMVALVPIQTRIGKKLSGLRSRLVKFTDARVMAMNEILQGIRILKFYGWEKEYEDKVHGLRADETAVLQTQANYNAVNYFVMLSSMLMVSSTTYIVYAFTHDPLEPGAIFSSMALFGLLWFPISFLPNVMNMLIETVVAVRRLSAFLNADELPQQFGQTREPLPYLMPSPSSAAATTAAADRSAAAMAPRGAISVTDGVFTWEPESAVPTLADVSLTIAPGSLVVVVGRVGSGKSTLLSALLGEVPRRSGSVQVSGSVAYAPQEAWVMNATLMDNVLFGRKDEYNDDCAAHGSAAAPMVDKYVETLRATALLPDLAILPAGDSTEIGEKGINLSGGQKARVALARAVFADTDIVLLDDPLSAVDVHVGKHIFEHAILDPSVLGRKTRVLVTHQLQYLPSADLVVVVDAGSIQHVGTYQDLLAQGVDFVSIAEANEAASPGLDDAVSPELSFAPLDGGDSTVELDTSEVLAALAEADAKPVEELKGVTIGPSLGVGSADDETKSTGAESEAGPSGSLMTTEERNTGAVKWRVYLYYLRAFGGVVFGIVVLVLFIAAEATRVSQDYWLAKWSSDTHAPLSKYLPTYVILGLSNTLLLLARSLLFARAGVAASRALHSRLFANILRAPMSFFDTTPIGRILSRFSKDIDSIDNSLPKTLHSLGGTLFRCLATLILVAVIIPWFLIPCVPVIFAYGVVQQYYRRTSRELKRLDSVSRSPVYALFSETITGAPTIRAYALEEHFEAASAKTVDNNHRAYILSMASNRWLSVRLELLGNLLVVFTAMLCVVERGKIDPGLVGLTIAYTLRITDSLNWTVRMATQAEVESNSVERIMHYTLNVDSEPPAVVHEYRAPPGWPHRGAVEFNNVTMRYRPDLEPALRDCSFRIDPGTKVGVVGRTGAGKSSLILCIFRLVELSEGNIIIDDMNISRMGLDDLRRSIAIIPQNPVLFSGTIRTNLDPFNNHSDEELWEALERAHLDATIRATPEGLAAPVSENGENYSVGERQLLCLARALLRHSSIVIMDEATSAADVVTDQLIQTTVRSEFRHATVICIAHRLNTIMDSDRILVMDSGAVREFDSPAALIDNPDSVFAEMVAESGDAAFLRAIARGEADPLAAIGSAATSTTM
ncbi:ABC transporter C family member 1 [Thecamonas trahens ATCC 50062]|uniref:ABC transporter C family member 1 n=1 Tax=Thecamonas trahens ATCC 50062 TaxID=461836 RepID=A0A0L0DBR0_THETB|nr:ABC transporter C family member 1 [Thecamonas trahens ATCC 50062]KNC48738.1 ABC transporter C family member 1 [Thecamonas trahens ATCC 50062]|eukprot:XP_013762790.1 ABC transporter C family member 1 [Thecamonas trahens ATCC 50062]